MTRTMNRWGLSMGVSPREPLANVTELALQAEGHGFEAMWFIDFQLGMKDVYAAMNLAALATERMHIGSAVTNLVTRHPTVTANATVALDELSGGHAMLGLGAGWSAVLGAGGRPSKLGDLRQGIAEFRALFSGEPAQLYGTEVQIAAAHHQIPIYLAVSQPGMLRLAGEACDGAILMGAADLEFCAWQLDFIREGLAKAGRDRSELLIDLIVTMSVDEDEERALSAVRAWATSQAATMDVWKSMPPAWERFRPEFAAASRGYHLVDHLSRHAGHKKVVSDDFVRSVALVGDERTCVERLRELAALDIDRITFALLSGGRRRHIAQLAERIIPAVAAG
ncbi:LLM class flavin-dependent oxidoreductase [Actinomadura madurae]|uniref:LLM class flavin-dependent oxidoreductase n=1 Tax=Actinomadura madurae TaxID=1993 RepID=UPI000D9630A7|nr:LLM class flavin-dependent oxidoreductase [Actinomadura madurae]SPT49890.1 F420-dependent glucose-6-phosphate dehydrogenase [Actinomadura madurae]